MRAHMRIRSIGIYLLLTAVTLAALFPVYWLLLTSFQPKDELMRYPPIFFTRHPTLENWRFAVGQKLYTFWNSLIVSTATTVIGLLLGATSGYAFARYKIGGTALPVWILALQYFPPIVAIVPYFLLMSRLHITDTLIGLIIPHLIVTIPFATWMMRGFVKEVPRALEEAAMIDGCSQFEVIRRITLPLVAPGLVVTALFCFIWSWNYFMYALVLTRSSAMTMPVAIAGMREAHGVMWGGVSATAALATVPILILAIALQRYLVRGLTFGAVK